MKRGLWGGLLLLLAGCGGNPPPPLKIVTVDLPEATVGYEYKVQLDAEGGKPPYHWQIAPGSNPLPPGLELDFNSGVISGTPLADAGGYTGKPKKWEITVEIFDSEAQ